MYSKDYMGGTQQNVKTVASWKKGKRAPARTSAAGEQDRPLPVRQKIPGVTRNATIFICPDQQEEYRTPPMTCSAITGPVFRDHDCEGHVECHARLVSIRAGLPEGIPVHPPVAASDADLERVHRRGYLAWLKRQCRKNADFCFLDDYTLTGGYMEQNRFVRGYIDPNTYVNPCSYEVATFAAGSAAAAVDRALSGEPCFALVRPPGHHAGSTNAMGFCLLNNAAVAAGYARTAVDRVAIVDWDNHHGNGTQEIFYADDRVLYCSVHQEDSFPHTGAAEETGTGRGTGTTINVPLPGKSTVAEYWCAFTRIVIPALRRFRPSLILISAGQDMLADDPVGGMKLTPADTGLLASLVRAADPDIPLALVLEGGYGPSHPDAIRCIFEALGGDEMAGPPGPALPAVRDRVRHIARLHGLPDDLP